MEIVEEPDALPGLANRRPRVVCESLEVSSAARDCLAADPSPTEFLRALLHGGLHRDALQYLAHALPRRAAVRWACACVAATGAASRSCQAAEALHAAQRWAERPDAVACARVALAAEQDGLQDEGAARFAALAAAWSGESLAPEGHPIVPPTETLGAAATAMAVVIASSSDACAAHGRQKEFLAMAILAARAAV